MSYKKRIFIWDLETAPALAHIWSLFQREGALSTEMLAETGRIISWRGKVYGQKKMYGADEYSHSHDDMIRELHKELDRADIVCGYNSNSFDNKLANHAFVKLGLTPPTPYEKIDLLKVVRKQFKFPSNKLGFVCQELGIETKLETGGFDLWKGWMRGDKDSIKTMRKYNEQDVIITEKLYERLIAWVDNHPTVIYYEEGVKPTCTNCGSKELINNGRRYSNGSSYIRLQCQSCGTHLQGRKKEVDSVPTQLKAEKL